MTPTESPQVASASRIVVMGVSGSGKSTIGRAIAARLGFAFVEGDELHPARNIERMAAGTPLTDTDRAGWLDAIAERIAAARDSDTGLIVACSALKRAYRDRLRVADAGLRFVHLQGEPALLRERIAQRHGHYMPPSLLESQMQTLEPPDSGEDAATFDVCRPSLAVAAAVLGWLGPAPPRPVAHPGFGQVILYTAADGRARFREAEITLSEGTPAVRLSPLTPSAGWQLRSSPVGFRSEFHCTGTPQWVFVLAGYMEIGLQDGSSRVFGPGEHFYSADTLPDGATFDPAVHGHRSRQVGASRLVTLFLRAPLL